MTGRSPKSIKRETDLRRLAEEGKSASEAAALLGIGRGTVRLYEKRHSIQFEKPKKPEIISYAFRVEAETRNCAGAGMTREEAAAHLGVSYQTIVKRAIRYGIKFRHGSAGTADIDRAETMASMYQAGKTLEEIGQLYGITRERVRQIMTKTFGMRAKDGGQAFRSKKKAEAKASERDLNCMEKLGCGWDEYVKIREIGRELKTAGRSKERTPMGAFISQKSNANSRGIDWNLKFWDWWNIWQDSGKWEQRGRGRGYMMCRFGDEGGYEIGNVYVATGIHNSKVQKNNPYRTGHPDHWKVLPAMREAARKRNNLRGFGGNKIYDHLPVGVTFSKGRYQAQISLGGRNRYLGRFDDAEVAHQAYLSALAEYDSTVAAGAA